MNPATFNLGISDIDKALKILTKKTTAEMAQTIRIRRMMLFLEIAVEPIPGADSILNDEIQLGPTTYKESNDNYKQWKGMFKDKPFYSIMGEGYFVNKNEYTLAKNAFIKLKKDKAYLEDLAIAALQLCESSFRKKTPEYLKDRIRNFEKWEETNVPEWARTFDSEASKTGDMSLPFGIQPHVFRVLNFKKNEYLVLYKFSEDWKQRREGSGVKR